MLDVNEPNVLLAGQSGTGAGELVTGLQPGSASRVPVTCSLTIGGNEHCWPVMGGAVKIPVE